MAQQYFFHMHPGLYENERGYDRAIWVGNGATERALHALIEPDEMYEDGDGPAEA